MSEPEGEPAAISHSGMVQIGPLSVRVHVLTDGSRIIPEEDFAAALDALGLSPEEAAAFMGGEQAVPFAEGGDQ